MPTENRRIATYLPKHIDERLQAFKIERDLKGDSQALIFILSEFFQVSQEATHQSSSVISELQKRLEALEEKFVHVKDELLSELRKEVLDDRVSSIEQIESEVKDKLLSEPESELSKPDVLDGQLKLIPEKELPPMNASGELLSDLQDPPQILDLPEQTKWITTKEAFDALKPDCSYSTFRSLSPEELYKRYGLQVDPHRKKGKHNVKWLKLPVAEDLSQALPATEKRDESELLSESDSVIPDF